MQIQRNCRYKGRTLKLQTDFWLDRRSVLLTPILFNNQFYFLFFWMNYCLIFFICFVFYVLITNSPLKSPVELWMSLKMYVCVVHFFVTLRTGARQVPLSVEFFRQNILCYRISPSVRQSLLAICIWQWKIKTRFSIWGGLSMSWSCRGAVFKDLPSSPANIWESLLLISSFLHAGVQDWLLVFLKLSRGRELVSSFIMETFI